VHFTNLVNLAGNIQDAFGGCRLASIYVGEDAYIPVEI
jgi:hypothetical protein